jgi:hypothetical protein
MTGDVEKKPPQSDLCGVVSNVRTTFEYSIADVVERSGHSRIKEVFRHLSSAPEENNGHFQCV